MKFALAFLLLCTGVARAQALELHVIALDTHGDALLVRTPGGKSVLVDAGLPQAGPQVVAYLRAQGVTSLDLVVLSHHDPDHFGGLPLVLDAFPARALWESASRVGGLRKLVEEPLEQALEQHRVPRTEVLRGERLELEPGVTLEALAPTTPFFTTPRRDDPNGDSIVLRLTHTTALGATRILFTGDATRATEARLLADGVDVRCDLLKVAHHGIDTTSSTPFLRATGARAAVISCSPGSGMPSADVLARLGTAGLHWYRTDLNGTIVVRSTGDPAALEVRPARGVADDARSSPFPGVTALALRYARLPAVLPPPGDFVGAVGRRLVHRSSCVVSRLIPSWDRVTFSSEQTAEAAGRAPCPLCRP